MSVLMILTTVLRMLYVKMCREVTPAPVMWDLWEMDRHVCANEDTEGTTVKVRIV